MRDLADGVSLLDGFPRDNRNAYLVEDVLVDAGIPLDRRRILRQLAGRRVSKHVVTHAHPDHYGSSHAVCTELSLPLHCGPRDAAAIEAGKAIARGGRALPGSPAHPVSGTLAEGEEVAGFTVLDVPGHSPGHIALWRESDRVLICGDVMWGYHPFRCGGPIREPLRLLSPDPERNRASARRLASLEPRLVCFGHGPPAVDPGAFQAAVAGLG